MKVGLESENKDFRLYGYYLFLVWSLTHLSASDLTSESSSLSED